MLKDDTFQPPSSLSDPLAAAQHPADPTSAAQRAPIGGEDCAGELLSASIGDPGQPARVSNRPSRRSLKCFLPVDGGSGDGRFVGMECVVR